MEISIGTNIKRLRKAMDISQEKLAEAVGVTVQAVSKWENNTSLPDICTVPEIAAFFGVTLDELFFGGSEVKPKISAPVSQIPTDDTLYVLMAKGGQILKQQEWEEQKRIYIDLGEYENKLTVEIWGNADIKGNINGGVTAKGGVNCGNVAGGVDANGGVNCGNIAGGVDAMGGVVCGNVSGGVDATGGVVCANVSGGVDVAGNVQCAEISGDIDCEGDIRCESIKNSGKLSCEILYVKGNVNCTEINGEVHTEGKIKFDY